MRRRDGLIPHSFSFAGINHITSFSILLMSSSES